MSQTNTQHKYYILRNKAKVNSKLAQRRRLIYPQYKQEVLGLSKEGLIQLLKLKQQTRFGRKYVAYKSIIKIPTARLIYCIKHNPNNLILLSREEHINLHRKVWTY